MSASPEDIKNKASLGSTIVEILRMPMEMVQDVEQTVVPDFRKQVHDLPDIIRQNFQFNLKSFQELPKTLQQNMKIGAKNDAQTLPMMLTKAASPIPLLSPDEIKQRREDFQKQTSNFINSSIQNAAESSTKQIDIRKTIEERSRQFAEQLAKANQK